MEELSMYREDLYDLISSFFKDNGTCRMKIQCLGNSMAPFIRNKNILTLKPLAGIKSLKKGDIVAASVPTEKRIIIHRIITARSPMYQLKGDSNKTSDGWFHIKDILSIVERIETEGGVGYTPRRWQNFVIALGSKANILTYAFFPGLKFLKT